MAVVESHEVDREKPEEKHHPDRQDKPERHQRARIRIHYCAVPPGCERKRCRRLSDHPHDCRVADH